MRVTCLSASLGFVLSKYTTRLLDVWCVEVLAPYAAREAGHVVPSARMCLARPLARNEGLGRGGRPTLMPPYTSLTHTSVCTVLHLVVFGESTLVSTIAATSLCSESMQSAAAARSQRCTRLTILLDWHAAHVGGAASGANRGAGSVAACFAMSARSQTPGCNLKFRSVVSTRYSTLEVSMK